MNQSERRYRPIHVTVRLKYSEIGDKGSCFGAQSGSGFYAIFDSESWDIIFKGVTENCAIKLAELLNADEEAEDESE